MTMRRIKPNPIPPVRPVWEFQADGDLADAYEAYKSAFQIPWVGVVSMAYAHYRNFFDTWWAGMEPLVCSQVYVDGALVLRQLVEQRITRLQPKSAVGRLTEMGYSPRELNEIRDMIEVLSHGNFVQLQAVFAARMLLEGNEFNGSGDKGPNAVPNLPDRKTPFVMIEPHHALGDQVQVYGDVKAILGLPFINTDYRCLARWPSYFDCVWADLRDVIPTAEYETMALEIHEAIVAQTATLPNPGGLTAEAVQTAAQADGKMTETLEVTKLFTWLLPGLMVNVAYFRAQLED